MFSLMIALEYEFSSHKSLFHSHGIRVLRFWFSLLLDFRLLFCFLSSLLQYKLMCKLMGVIFLLIWLSHDSYWVHTTSWLHMFMMCCWRNVTFCLHMFIINCWIHTTWSENCRVDLISLLNLHHLNIELLSWSDLNSRHLIIKFMWWTDLNSQLINLS